MAMLNVISIQLRALIGAGTIFSAEAAQSWAQRAASFIDDEEMRSFMHDELMVALASSGHDAAGDHEVMVMQLDPLKVLGRIEGLVSGRYLWTGR